jgi:hypothetical protein
MIRRVTIAGMAAAVPMAALGCDGDHSQRYQQAPSFRPWLAAAEIMAAVPVEGHFSMISSGRGSGSP